MLIKAKKSLGQNFLVDKNKIKLMVDLGNISTDDEILEIGPGTGNLTDFILKKKPKNFFVIEKDTKLANELKKRFTNDLKVINEDVLKFDPSSLSKDKIIVYGNLPYNISTQILSKWITGFQTKIWYKKLILMFQKEVADRILAEPNNKKYSRISIITNWKLNVKKEFDLNPKCFTPIPKIHSTLLSFTPKKKFFLFKNPKNLEKITAIFFSHRRKKIRNSLKKIFNNSDKVAKELDLNLDLRPENLNPETYFKITKEFEKSIS